MHLIEEFRRRALKKRGLIASPNSRISSDIFFEPPVLIGDAIIGKNVRIGKRTYINSGRIWDDCLIGRYCSLSYNLLIGPPDHPTNYLSTMVTLYSETTYYKEQKKLADQERTEIGNDVWIGANSFIRRGIKVADGVIIGSGSVVVKDIPAYSIVGGVPAQIIKYRFPPDMIEKLLESKWWNLDEKIIQNLPFNDIQKCISIIDKTKS